MSHGRLSVRPPFSLMFGQEVPNLPTGNTERYAKIFKQRLAEAHDEVRQHLKHKHKQLYNHKEEGTVHVNLLKMEK